MKVAVISSIGSANTADLLAAAWRRDVICHQFALKDVTFSVDTIESDDFFSYDVYIFRGYNRNYAFAQSLAWLLNHKNKIVIDSALVRGTIASKFYQAIVYKVAGVKHIPTYSAQNYSHLVENGFRPHYPVVVKDVNSQKGKGVRLVHDEVSLKHELSTFGHSVIVQEYIKIPYDIRVICVGEKIIGAIKRQSSSSDFRTNVSLGGVASAYKLNDQEKALALKAHHSMGFTISGVDIAHDETGEPFVIETNITPEWQGFKSATGIDVGQEIIDYILETHEQAKL